MQSAVMSEVVGLSASPSVCYTLKTTPATMDGRTGHVIELLLAKPV